MLLLHDRYHAGQELAKRLALYANKKDSLVLALPRGGVPVAFEIANALHLPLDVFIVRKLGVPGHEELALGAIASGNVIVFNETVLHLYGLQPASIERVCQKERQELARREQLYRGNKPPLAIENHEIILVDDGFATGATMRAALSALRKLHPKRIIVAVPVAPSSIFEQLSEADEIVYLTILEPFYSVSQGYQTFPQTEDSEVCSLLKKAEIFAQSAA